MQDQENLNESSYEMPINDIGDTSSKNIVGQSSGADIISAASGIDPSRFWIVFIVILCVGLASILGYSGWYLVDQNNKKDNQIDLLQKELKACPEKALVDLQKQQQTIEDLKKGVIYNSERIMEVKNDKMEDVDKLKTLDQELTKNLK